MESDQPAQGGLTVWHGWEEEAKLRLDSIISNYLDRHEGVAFRIVQLSLEDIPNQYALAVREGNGPDMQLGPAGWGADLGGQGLVASLDEMVPSGLLEAFPHDRLASLYREGLLYGLPANVGRLRDAGQKDGSTDPQAFFLNPQISETNRETAWSFIAYVLGGI